MIVSLKLIYIVHASSEGDGGSSVYGSTISDVSESTNGQQRRNLENLSSGYQGSLTWSRESDEELSPDTLVKPTSN